MFAQLKDKSATVQASFIFDNIFLIYRFFWLNLLFFYSFL